MAIRKLNIEFIRIFSVIMVISIHVANVYINNFEKVSPEDFLISVIFSSFSRVCVPLFFMISGAFIIDKEYDRKKYFEKILKFIIVLVIWSVIYYLSKNGFDFKDIGKVIVNSFFNANKTSRHLWYMYPLIAIYIALPFIQNMCKNMSRELENLFLILWFCLSGLTFIFLPLASFITKTDIKMDYPVPIINSAYYLGYFIGGHIIYKRVKNLNFSAKNNIICILIYIACSIITTLATYFISIKAGYAVSPPTWYRGSLVILASFSVFILLIANEKKFKNPLIMAVSRHTFGIYLIHMVFLNIIKWNIDVISLSPMLTIPLFTLIVYISSLLVCMLLSKIPFVKKIIF